MSIDQNSKDDKNEYKIVDQIENHNTSTIMEIISGDHPV